MLAGCSPAANEKTTARQNDTETTQGESRSETTQNESTSGEAGSDGQAAPAHNYKDGTYTGTGRGMGGDITVTLTVAGGVVTVDEITGPYETPGVGGKEAIEDGSFKSQIEKAQSSDIDGITGATMTTGGVKKAVEDALSQAK
ncbi:MAG: FMN-binding protein [Lachnospiraceae bacterium]|nr:FMN-binding protein [Lachnospiraceae bacterium]